MKILHSRFSEAVQVMGREEKGRGGDTVGSVRCNGGSGKSRVAVGVSQMRASGQGQRDKQTKCVSLWEFSIGHPAGMTKISL